MQMQQPGWPLSSLDGLGWGFTDRNAGWCWVQGVSLPPWPAGAGAWPDQGQGQSPSTRKHAPSPKGTQAQLQRCGKPPTPQQPCSLPKPGASQVGAVLSLIAPEKASGSAPGPALSRGQFSSHLRTAPNLSATRPGLGQLEVRTDGHCGPAGQDPGARGLRWGVADTGNSRPAARPDTQ